MGIEAGSSTYYQAKRGVVQDGLVLHLDAGVKESYGGTGTTWYDISGNNNHGTLTNGPTYNIANGGNILFDGSNDFCISERAWNDTDENWSGDITIEAMFKATNSFNRSFIGFFGLHNSSSFFKFMSSTNLFLDCRTTASSRVTLPCISNFSNYFGQWVHVCGVYDGVAKTYFNGILQNISGSFTLNDISSLQLLIGVGMGYYPFQGNFGNVKIYNRALSANEVQQNFNATRHRFGL